MLIVAGLLAPYLIAVLSFPVLLRCKTMLWPVAACACSLIVLSPWLIPADLPLCRFVASISAAIVAVKVIDASLDVRNCRAPTWSQHIGFLVNPFTHVRRGLGKEPTPTQIESLSAAISASASCAVAVVALVVLFGMDWSGIPFLAEHVCKVAAFMLAMVYALNSGAAIWRLGGGIARDYMDRPFLARTPAEFWRRYNRNVHQFFWQDVFSGKRSRRAPIRTILLVFALSALLHELIFLAPIGQVQGYQTAFFALQGMAAASTARFKARGWQVVPFYSSGLPPWLR